MHWTVVVFLFCLAGFATSDPILPPIPIQPRTPGYRYLPFEPPPAVRFEVFIDLNCHDSTAAWPIVKDVQAHYGNDRLDLVFQQLTVAYHKNSFISTSGWYVIENWDPTFCFNYAEEIMDHYVEFGSPTTVNKTENQIIGELAGYAVASTGIDRDYFINDIRNHEETVAGLWKYSTKRGVAGPPTYFVNGVDVVVGQAFVPTYDEWITFFDTLIPAR